MRRLKVKPSESAVQNQANGDAVYGKGETTQTD